MLLLGPMPRYPFLQLLTRLDAIVLGLFYWDKSREKNMIKRFILATIMIVALSSTTTMANSRPVLGIAIASDTIFTPNSGDFYHIDNMEVGGIYAMTIDSENDDVDYELSAYVDGELSENSEQLQYFFWNHKGYVLGEDY